MQVLRRSLEERRGEAAGQSEVEERYGSDQLALAYRHQHRAPALRDLRLWLLGRREITAVERALDLVGGSGSVIDVPAGTGKIWPLLRRRGLRFVAVDASPFMLRAAGLRDASPVLADIRRLPFRDHNFDAAICLRLLHRTPSTFRVDALRELARVSREGVIVSYGLDEGALALRYRLLSFLRPRDWLPNPSSRDEIRSELAGAGLQAVDIRNVAGLL
jgi:SAM-dependent methyltransferase